MAKLKKKKKEDNRNRMTAGQDIAVGQQECQYNYNYYNLKQEKMEKIKRNMKSREMEKTEDGKV